MGGTWSLFGSGSRRRRVEDGTLAASGIWQMPITTKD